MPSFNFDASAHQPTETPRRGPLTPGMYQVMVVDSEIKQTQAGTGEYIALKLQVVDGEHSGRWIWDNLNIRNPNKTAEDIARNQLQMLCLAAGVTKMTNTEQLHDRPVLASVELDRKDPSRNRVVGYAALSAAQTPRATKPASATPESAKSAARPWERQ